MKRVYIIILTAISLVIGLWQIGEGSWIYIKAELAQYLLERAWTKTLNGSGQVAPWPWADTWPIARMQVQKYGIDLIVLSGANGRTLAFGPGHASSSAMPGTNGTTIFNAHRDTHFRFLEKIQKGDEIFMQLPDGKTIRYTTQEISIVDSRDTTIIQDNTQANLVLITCYPFNALTPGGPLRYVITANY